MLKDLNYICFDFETTGLDISKEEPIQIGILCFDKDFKITKTYKTYIKPAKDIKELKNIVSFLTGLKLSDLEDAPSIAQVLPEIAEFFTPNSVLIGHNIGFDIAMLNKYITPDHVCSIDTFVLARTVYHFLPSYALEILDEYLREKNINFKDVFDKLGLDEACHDAMYDSFACYKLFKQFHDILSGLIDKYPFLADFIIKSDGCYSQIFDFPKSSANKYFLPALKKEIKKEKKLYNKDVYDISKLEATKKIYVGNVDFDILLQRICSNSQKVVLSFGSKSKMNIAKKLLQQSYLNNIGFLNADLVFDQDKIDKFMSKDKYEDFEINFLIKYFSHLENNISFLDLNSVYDYRIHGYLSKLRDKKLPNIVLSTHQSLFEYIADGKTLDDHKILFFDAERWYQSFSRFLNKPYDFYDLIYHIENLIYQKSFEHKDLSALQDFYNFLLIFVGVLFAEITDLFKNFSVNKVEFGPIRDHVYFSKTTNLLNQFEGHISSIEKLFTADEFTELTDKVAEYIDIFDKICNISIKINNNEVFHFVFSKIENVINFGELLDFFGENKPVFFSDIDIDRTYYIDKSYQSTKTNDNIVKQENLNKILEDLSELDNIFILSVNKERSKEVFDKLISGGYDKTYTILGENITGGVGKSIFYAKRKTKKIAIGGYEFMLSMSAQDIKFERIYIYYASGPLQDQIIQDIKYYS